MALKPIYELVSKMKSIEKEFRQLQTDMPRYMGDTAVKVTKENFINGGYEGEKWKERSDATLKSYSKMKGSVYKNTTKTENILRVTNNLFDSIKYIAHGNIVDIGVNKKQVPYGEYHNAGGKRLPKRQWIGYGPKMRRRLKARMESLYKRLLKPIKK